MSLSRQMKTARSDTAGGGGEGQPHTFVDMQKNMADELEKRRKEWEKEVEQMQEDFFKVKIRKDSVDNDRLAINSSDRTASPATRLSPRSSTNDVALNSPSSRQVFQELPDGTKVFRMRFNVRDFHPDEISVRAEGSRLVVSAKHDAASPEVGSSVVHSSRTSKQFNKQVDIPDNVRADKLVSFLSRDGVLTVEAPLEEPFEVEEQRRWNAVSRSPIPLSPLHSPPLYESLMQTPSPRNSFDHQQHSPRTELLRTASPQQSSRLRTVEHHGGNPEIIDTEYGRKLKIIVDLGKNGYRPDEVKVSVQKQKISVGAKHEETVAGRTSRREFSREFELPEPVDTRTVRASLDRDGGQLTIGGSMASNVNHDMILESVMQDMPTWGKACFVEKLQKI